MYWPHIVLGFAVVVRFDKYLLGTECCHADGLASGAGERDGLVTPVREPHLYRGPVGVDINTCTRASPVKRSSGRGYQHLHESLTCAGVQGGGRHELNDVVDASLVYVHLPVADHEKLPGVGHRGASLSSSYV